MHQILLWIYYIILCNDYFLYFKYILKAATFGHLTQSGVVGSYNKLMLNTYDAANSNNII